jgi:hypothetical protein
MKTRLSFIPSLVEAMIKYTHQTPETNEGRFYSPLAFYLPVSPWCLQKNLQKLEDDPKTPLVDLIKVVTKIFNNKKEKQKTLKLRRDQIKSLMLAEAIQKGFQKGPRNTSGTYTSKGQKVPGTLFQTWPAWSLCKCLP